MSRESLNTIDIRKVRADKWLWAARFFKTRSLAKKAIEGGKIHIDGQRIKPSKEIEVGNMLQIRQGWDEKVVEVIKLSEQRGPASVAITLYQETPESIKKREHLTAERRAQSNHQERPPGKPNTRQRRHIHQFKRDVLADD